VSAVSVRRSKLSLRLGLIVAVLVAACLSGAASPASALEWNYATDGHLGQRERQVCVQGQPAGRQGLLRGRRGLLQINDMARDSYRTGVQWQTTGGRAGICVTTHGFENNALQAGWPYVTGGYSCNKDFPGEHACNKDFAEGSLIQFRAGRCDGSAVNCGVLGNWRDWSAWSPWYRISSRSKTKGRRGHVGAAAGEDERRGRARYRRALPSQSAVKRLSANGGAREGSQTCSFGVSDPRSS
jgi:hypothetical protein